MATELVTHVWCDLCMAEDRKEQGQPFPVVLRGTRYEIDLCLEHSQPLEALAATLDEHARRPDGPKRGRPPKATAAPPALRVVPPGQQRNGQHVCHVCGFTASSMHLLTTHARQRHGLTAAEFRGEPTPYQCPECGKRFGAGPGVALHRQRMHGVRKGQSTVLPAG